MTPPVSIIINTYNRAASLEKSLQSLRYLDYPNFEIIVVDGPSTDNTAEVLALWKEDIKIGSCPVANLSVSRNIGIAMAAGEIIAFMDDDAIPEPEWLRRLVDGYDDEEVGGVGGYTYNHTGYEFQARQTICDRFGGARTEEDIDPTAYFSFPNSFEYPAHLGTNSSFRRDRLLRIGGFDEEFEYYLDETDVCARMCDSGYVVKNVDDAFIHHKFLPSHIRNDNRVVTDWYSVIKNRAYFAFKNGCKTHDVKEIAENVLKFIEERRVDVHWAAGEKLIPQSKVAEFDDMARLAMKTGLTRALGEGRKLLSAETIDDHRQPFKQFPTIIPGGEARLTICYLTEYYPPGFFGGIARFTQDLAEGIARRGHNVHVVTCGEDHSTVDFENGVWIHRILPQTFDAPDIPESHQVRRKNYSYSRTVYEEVRRIDSHHRIDLIEAPIWGTEGYHCILDENFRARTIISLETTMKIAAKSRPEWVDNPDTLGVIEAEDFVLRNARGFHAISEAIAEEVLGGVGTILPNANVSLIPLGVKDRRDQFIEHPDQLGAGSKGSRGRDLKVLFVGRQEPRKGADVLLEVIPGILKKHPQVRFVLVGEDSIAGENGVTYKDEFLRTHRGEPFLKRVEFTGHIDEDDLYWQYADCDIFVAPSRYESFGLIFLEAMMFGKPVIGCRAGGMVEIVEPNGNGFLAEPGDRESLWQSLERLIEDARLRKRFGARSREIYKERFTDVKMTDAILDFYAKLINENMKERDLRLAESGLEVASP